MKNKFLIALSTIMLVAMTACEPDDGLVFTVSDTEAEVSFSNSLLANYLLSFAFEDNIAERFIWDATDFGAPTNVTYELHGSTDSQFGTFDVIGSTANTNISITVGDLLDYAVALGLDDDPATTDAGGNANNTGQVYFRLRAFAGTTGDLETFSDGVALNITWIERSPEGGACPSWWVVGEASTQAGWAWDTPVEFTCENNVYTARIALQPGAFRFFTTEGDWGSGQNFPFFAGDGYTIDANFEDAMDGDNNFRFTGTAGFYDLVIDAVNKTITLTVSPPQYLVGEAIAATGWDWGNRPELIETAPFVYSASVEFVAGAFRIFTVDGDWGSGRNYPYYEDEGYTIDANFENAGDGDSNFRFIGTPGTYTLTVNDKDKTITLQ